MADSRWTSAAMLRLTAVFVVFQQFAGVGAQKLPGHSIVNLEDMNALNADWWLAGSAIPSGKAIVLNPGVRNRAGMLWNRYPLLTNSFDVSFTINVRKPAKKASKNDGFAFWVTYENASEAQSAISISHVQKQEEIIADTWGAEMKAKGFDLLSYRSKYDGLGVFFVNDESPSVSVVPNDGTKTFNLGAGLPTYDAMKFDWVQNHEFTVKMKLQPDSVTVEIEGGKGSATIKTTTKQLAYIGFSSFGGEKLPDVTDETCPFVELVRMEVVNLDTNQKGEEVHAAPPPRPVPNPGEKVDVLAESSSFKDHRSESDAIKELTNMVFKLAVETQPQRQQMARSIETLAKRIDAMEGSFAELKAELDKKTGHKLGEEFEAIKKELTSLSSVASKDTEERHTRLQDLHKEISEVHKNAHSPDNLDKHLDSLTESNSKVLNQLNSEHQTMFGISLAAIAFVIIAGLSLYNKFRCWEKKHVL